jgi:hypothetical protein
MIANGAPGKPKLRRGHKDATNCSLFIEAQTAPF